MIINHEKSDSNEDDLEAETTGEIDKEKGRRLKKLNTALKQLALPNPEKVEDK